MLTLNLAAVGLIGQQLPEIVSQQLAGFSAHAGQAKVETTLSAQGNALGTRAQKIAFIPRQADEFTIPDIELRWWDTQTDREEIARLPGITRNVVADLAMPVATAALPPIAQQVTTDQPAAEAQPVFAITIWMWLSALFAAAWLSTVVMWVRACRRTSSLSDLERIE
jgi:hypothetical protein